MNPSGPSLFPLAASLSRMLRNLRLLLIWCVLFLAGASQSSAFAPEKRVGNFFGEEAFWRPANLVQVPQLHLDNPVWEAEFTLGSTVWTFFDPRGLQLAVVNGQERLVAGVYGNGRLTIHPNGMVTTKGFLGFGGATHWSSDIEYNKRLILQELGVAGLEKMIIQDVITDITENEQQKAEEAQETENIRREQEAVTIAGSDREAKEDAERDMRKEGEFDGEVYRVPGKDTPSGLPYIGTSDDADQRARTANDGRDRSNRERVGSYPIGDTEQRRQAEQDAMDDEGGIDNLDNKRNEKKKE